MELSLFTMVSPEGWTLPSYLAVVVQVSKNNNLNLLVVNPNTSDVSRGDEQLFTRICPLNQSSLSPWGKKFIYICCPRNQIMLKIQSLSSPRQKILATPCLARLKFYFVKLQLVLCILPFMPCALIFA